LHQNGAHVVRWIQNGEVPQEHLPLWPANGGFRLDRDSAAILAESAREAFKDRAY
jgi:hypothetical protein